MRINLYIISNNYTNIKQKIIDLNEINLNIKNLIEYLYNYNMIYDKNVSIFYDNKEIENIDEIIFPKLITV